MDHAVISGIVCQKYVFKKVYINLHVTGLEYKIQISFSIVISSRSCLLLSS